MEKYNWIKAYYGHDTIVGVRQVSEGSEIFVDGAGNEFNISELDFTRNCYESQFFDIEEIKKRNNEINQQYQESQAMYMEMLSKMDANSIADHKAKIDEREYWRKLRGDILLGLLTMNGQMNPIDKILEMTEQCFTAVYNQDKDFFKDK